VRFCKQHGYEILALNNETLSTEREMVEDLMTIVHCFSRRLYGLRNYKKSLKLALVESDNKKI
jgi:putative resolvase